MEGLYKKHLIPLESNPDVFNYLIHLLGISLALTFQDVFSIDEPDLLPHPALALVLVFPTTDGYEIRKIAEEATYEEYGGSGEDEDVVYAARDFIEPDSLIANLLESCIHLTLQERALVLEKSEELENAYKTAAVLGDSEIPDSPEDEVDFHYVCFFKSHQSGRLYELDGDRKGPINKGHLVAPGEDILAQGGLDVVREFMKSECENPNFSLMALVHEQEELACNKGEVK
ncbi:putative ubiquitin carboxyl-terminal hydrolase [Lachnellula arida]|uniref:Ubiquitin carboxyl-terminal hydrolase n=1 Tax=Lachnellula arida TaxID=1316785 RepID=A0A8T9B292_9HELO|nr:putative ubiquitin carboxyl-terminal hydrolase [Lachnellula arida]